MTALRLPSSETLHTAVWPGPTSTGLPGWAPLSPSLLPATMIPKGIETLGCHVAPDIESCVEGADVVMMLRIQKERQETILFPSEREYATRFGLTRERLALARKDAIVMHPGPMNRGVEIANLVADGKRSVILEQVTNGVALRMAVFYLVAGGKKYADKD